MYVRVQLHYFAQRYSVFPAPLDEKFVLSPLNNLSTLYSIPLVMGYVCP